MAEAAAVNPIVDIISRLWTCCARHTRYLCKLQQNMDLLRNAMNELKNVRNDVQRKVVEAEADPNEPKMRTDSVSGWLQSVEKIEGEVEVILHKAAGEQFNRARSSCLGGCRPPNNCWSSYKLGKSIAKKIPLVNELKVKGDFQELTYVARPMNYLSKLQENKILLRNAMAELKEARDDVQRRVVAAEADPNEPKKRTDSVSGWLQRVETIEGEVEVILLTSDEQLSSAECHEKDKLVVMKKAYVDELKGKGNFQELTYRLLPPPVQYMNLESTVGMDFMFDKVWRILLTNTYDDKPPVRIMGLYGHGGVGKTTLLKKINNEFSKISSGHDLVMFVVVSKPINYEDIQKKIGDRLGCSLQGDGHENSRAQKIFDALRNKNYVLLLDDIWERVDLRRIGIPIHPQGNSSKLIFTTRSQRVCGLMEATHTFQVECLPWDKAWSLFQDKVGEKALNYLSGARELAKDVAKECGGLPLALITIGRAMSTKKSVQEWRDAVITLRRYASEFEGMSDEVLPSLKLSYDYLHNETEKSCFRYCALFPEDYSIEITKLVDLWIAEGFLDGIDKLDEARDRGHSIIGSLKSACLLESNGEYNREKTHVKMHGVIRDLTLWIVNYYCSSRRTSEKFLVAVNDPCKKWENAERIFWDTTHYRSNNEEVRSSTLPILLTLIAQKSVTSCPQSNHPPTFTFPNLLTLTAQKSVTSCPQSNHPPTFPNLPTLTAQKPVRSWPQSNHPPTFPNLSTLIAQKSVMSWPQSNHPPTSPNLLTLIVQNMGIVGYCWLPTLFQHMPLLRVLDLSNIRSLNDEFLASICELHELQYLNLSGTDITTLPVQWRKLGKLKFLVLGRLRRIPAGLIANLSELQVLDLGCHILSSGLEDWELEDGPSFSELDGLKQLQEVRITITTYVALDKFLCNRKLQMVCTGLKCSSSSDFSSSSRRVLDLSNFKSLKDLKIYGFSELEELVLCGSTTGGGLLSNLETLRLHSFPKLNNIVWMAAQPHLLRSPFQNLYEVIISHCDALKDLIWLVYVKNLKELRVHSCEELETIIKLNDDGLEGTGGGGGGGIFRRLETLQILDLPKLKSICRHELALPSIETISIRKCPELKKLPLGSGSNVENTLKWIRGEPEWCNELQWEDETIKSKFLPYLNKMDEQKRNITRGLLQPTT